jgi:hypothetical protein
VSAAGAKVDAEAPTPTAAAKLLSPGARKAWERAFVSFACDELNGLYDRLAIAAEERKPCPPDIRDRMQAIVRALSWSRDTVIGHVWSLIDDGLDRPVDAFAAAVILTALSPDDPKVKDWLPAQPAGFAAMIEYAAKR